MDDGSLSVTVKEISSEIEDCLIVLFSTNTTNNVPQKTT